jgi:hypothetical protein
VWRQALHPFLFLSGLDVDWDVAKKKAVSKGEDSARKQVAVQGNDAAAGTARARKKKKKPIRCIQQHTDVEFRREFPEVFDALVNKAKEGGVAETRILLQIGRFGDPKTAKGRKGKSLSEMLLDELKRRQDEREAATDSTKIEAQIIEANGTRGEVNQTGSEGAIRGGDAENG